MKKHWWKEGVIYQIYPRSFCDSNGDGIGDLNGIRSQLSWLKNLGVEIVWLSPVYQSPNDDNGYDISDYYRIMDEFGTMEDFEHLLAEVHSQGMKLVMDLVVNHTSDEHFWFQESKKSKDNPYRNYYIWRPPLNGGLPNNWKSFFSGSAWEWDENTGEYYLHLFSRKQPDLNWDNPEVRQEVYRLMRFWLDKGIDGFRMDVIPFISKPEGLPDKDWANMPDYGVAYANGPRVHEYIKEMHREVLSHYDIMTIGEGVGISAEMANLYVGDDRGELNMIFHFDHMFIDHGQGGRMDPVGYSLNDFLAVFERWEKALGEKGWGSIYLGNHDFPRMVSRFGDDGKYWEKSAKMLATLVLTRKGTPCIYQGDEMGMTNTPFASIAEYRDIEILNAWKQLKKEEGDEKKFLSTALRQARDHARTPMQWTDGDYAGFSTHEPWIRVNSNVDKINAGIQMKDENSVYHYYRNLIGLRKQYNAWIYGETTVIPTGNEDIYAYIRTLADQEFLIMLNFSGKQSRHSVFATEGEMILNNYPAGGYDSMELRPWEAVIVKLK
ncbi:MAG: alpha-glucosidase [Bacteroidia bacterium]